MAHDSQKTNPSSVCVCVGGEEFYCVYSAHCLASAFNCENVFLGISYWIWKNYGFNFLSEEKENLLDS